MKLFLTTASYVFHTFEARSTKGYYWTSRSTPIFGGAANYISFKNNYILLNNAAFGGTGLPVRNIYIN